MTARDVEFYMGLDYPEEVAREEGIFFATVPDLPGLMAEGKTRQEALANLRIAKREWFKAALDSKFPIPRPRSRPSR